MDGMTPPGYLLDLLATALGTISPGAATTVLTKLTGYVTSIQDTYRRFMADVPGVVSGVARNALLEAALQVVPLQDATAGLDPDLRRKVLELGTTIKRELDDFAAGGQWSLDQLHTNLAIVTQAIDDLATDVDRRAAASGLSDFQRGELQGTINLLKVGWGAVDLSTRIVSDTLINGTAAGIRLAGNLTQLEAIEVSLGGNPLFPTKVLGKFAEWAVSPKGRAFAEGVFEQAKEYVTDKILKVLPASNEKADLEVIKNRARHREAWYRADPWYQGYHRGDQGSGRNHQRARRPSLGGSRRDVR